MQLRILVLSGCFCLLNCNQGKNEKANNALLFDKTKWAEQYDNDYPYRDKMFKNLFETDTLKKLRKDGILSILGQPTRSDTNYLFYILSQERIGILPLHTKTLVIKFSGDTTVEWVKIHE
jgi:hypothetical protein